MNSTELAPENKNLDNIFWILTIGGICLSTLGVIVQVCAITVYRQCRNLDEVILCEMTVARTLIGLCELYVLYYMQVVGMGVLSCAVIAVYIHSDIVLLILMFLFTKNIFTKIVNVFSVRSYNLVTMSLYVWLAPLPFSVLCVLLWTNNFKYFATYYKVYAHIKFSVLAINMLGFCMIIYVTIKRRLDRDRNLMKYLKTTVILFLLVTMVSLQVLVTDLISYYYEHLQSDILVKSFATVNSYQVVAILAYFVLLVRNKFNNPVSASVRFSEVTANVSV